MLQILQTGKALYVLMAICFIGVMSKMITRGLYKRLIKETDNMAMTKNQNMKSLKQKLENAYRLNQAIMNTQAYLEKQMYGFRFMRMSLDGWNNISSQAMLLCLFLGGTGSFLAYWYGIDSYYIVLYGSMGILGGLLMALVDASANVPLKKQQLSSALVEYVDNSVFVRAARERDNSGEGASLRETTRAVIRDDAREAVRENVREIGSWDGAREKGVKEAKVRTAVAREAKKRIVREPQEQPVKDAGRKDIDYLKHSLEQIAASREKERVKEDWTKNLEPEEIKVLGEIIREYFGNN